MPPRRLERHSDDRVLCRKPGVAETFRPDHVTNYELGVKGSLGDNWVYNADAFYVSWKDPQLNTGTTLFGYIAVQNGKSRQHQRASKLQLDNYYGEPWHVGLGYTC